MMGKAMPKAVKPADEKQGPPELVLVEKPPQPQSQKTAAAPAAETKSTKTTQARRDLHPARVWPD